MKKRILIAACLILLVIPAIVGVLFVALTAFSNFSSSAGGTLASGRSINVTSDSISLSCEFGGETATIKTTGKTIVIKKDLVLIGGEQVAEIDPATAKVDVVVKRGSVTFVADGNPVPTTTAATPANSKAK